MPKCNGIVLGVIGFGLTFLPDFNGLNAIGPRCVNIMGRYLKKKGAARNDLFPENSPSLVGNRQGVERRPCDCGFTKLGREP